MTMTQSTQSSSKKRLLYHFFIGNLARRNKRGRSPPCSSSSSLPVQSLALTDSNNNSIVREDEQNVNRDVMISDRIHYYPLTRYYVIVLMSLATIIISSSFILPTCTATALADPVPIRISHSFSALKDAAPKQIAKDSSSSEYKIKSSNKNSNYANNNSSNNANSPLTSFSQPQPFYTRLSVQENAFRPSYLYATKTIPIASTTSKAAFLRGEESTTTTDPITITNLKRLSHDPFFNFVNNFQSLTSTSTESTSVIDRSSSNTDNLPATQLQTERSKTKKKSRKRTRQDDDDSPFAFPLPNPIVITSTTSKPTLHPLLVLETEMRTTTSSTPSPIKDESSVVLFPSVNIEDITKPNSGPFPDSGRANSGQESSHPPGKLTFEEYNELHRKSKNKSAKKKTTTTTTENYISNHNSGFSPSSGVVPNDADSKRLRSNFFDNFHDTEVDNIAEESGGAEVTVEANDNGSDSGTHVNIPAGYTHAKKQSPAEEFHYSEATNGNSNSNNNNNDKNNNEQRNEQNSNNHHQQYQLKPSLHFPSNNYHTGLNFQPSQPVHRIPPKPISKLRPNLQSYYDNSYHKFTAAAENQYENHGNSYGSRPPSPNYPPLPHLPLPIAIPMSSFPSHQPPHMRPYMHHHHPGHGPPHHPHHHHHRPNNHGSHYYGNNFAAGLSTKPTQPTGDSNVNPSGGDNSLENDNQQQGDIQITNPSGVIPTLPVTVFSSPTTYGLEHSASESGLHTNKKVGIMDTFEIFYKEYKILTWAAFLIVTSLALLCLVVFLYVNNPPTEVVTARNHLQEMLTSPQLVKFLSNLIEGGRKSRRKSNSREGKNRWKLSATQQPKKDL